MIISIILIIFSGLFIISTQKIIFKISKPGFDHYWTLSYIKDLQLKRKRKIKDKYHFVAKHSNILEENNFSYPLFFHWILSFLPFDFISKKYLKINFFLEGMLYLSALLLAFSFDSFKNNEKVGIALLLIVTNPFNRYLWNAKARGISPRNFGIILSYIYLFFLSTQPVATLVIIKIFLLLLISFLIILASQFTTQYIILLSFFYLIFYQDYIPIICVILAFLCLAVIFPFTFQSYFKGQIQHKKIWFKHIAKIDLWKARPSIYRDFIFDFFRRRSIKYFLTNPIIEVILGFPLIPVLAIVSSQIIFKNQIILSALFAFIITSFKYTRAFGEPQRYLEMALPSLIFLALKYLTVEYLFIIILFNIVFFLIHLNAFANFNNHDDNILSNKSKIILLIKNTESVNSLILANNWGMTGYFLPEKNIEVMMPTFTSWEQYGFPIDKIFPEHLFSLNKDVVKHWIQSYKPGWFFLDDYYWPRNEFESAMVDNGVKFSFQEQFRPVLLYKLVYE